MENLTAHLAHLALLSHTFDHLGKRPAPRFQFCGQQPFIGFVLIVARRKGQRIRIGDNIEVVVTELSRGEVRLGIVAPKRVPVVREEIRRAVEEANRQAAGADVVVEAHVGEVVVVDDIAGVAGFSSSPKAGTRS